MNGPPAGDVAVGAAGTLLDHQYREWLPFPHRNHVVLGRIAEALGYEVA
jgi:hypothetical protein